MPRMLIGVALLWMAALSGYDIRQRRLPNRLTLPGCAVITVAAAVVGQGRAAVIGAVALAAAYLVVHLLAPAAMGAGDVKLALGTGALTACFGPEAWMLAAIGAPLLTVVLGTVARVRSAVTTLPHGPSMCAASAAAILLA
jgi:leader peptidase (prepilin peptidase)/N-methyltransferase